MPWQVGTGRSLSRRWKDAREDVGRKLALRFIGDSAYLSRLYLRQFGRPPNLDNPQGFNEKILAKILRDRRAYLTLFSDKLRVRRYVRRIAPALSCPAIYWWSYRPDALPFDALPNEFVLKANHGSGWNLVVENKTAVTRRDLVRLGRRWLASDFTIVGREWAYRNVRRAIYAEELLRDPRYAALPDYKLFVFSGKVRIVQVDRDRYTRHTQVLYDERWNAIAGTVAAEQGEPLDPPDSLATMIAAAEALSAGVDFVRVDLYTVPGAIYFGELTKPPNKGMSPFRPAALDGLFGSYFRPDDYSRPVPLEYDPDAFTDRGTIA